MQVSERSVSTRYTQAFVSAHLPAGAKRILEVGCGAGELAAALQKEGFDVLALDGDPACVTAAASRGIDAMQLEWPAELDGYFDAVLFTRSLHHVARLRDSVVAARAVLRPGGRLIVEDFRAEGASERSNIWYRGLARTLSSSGSFLGPDRLADQLAAIEPSHHHELHASKAIAEALDCFARIVSFDAAYYFRYLEKDFRTSSAVEELLAHELALLGAGCIDALGKRFVAFDE